MKLKNKKTGEIVEPCEIYCDTQDKICVRRPGENFGAYIEYEYNSLAELNSEWEDYKEPIQVYIEGIQNVFMSGGRVYIDYATAKEAELAVRKLKAWKRLKDFGCRLVLDDHFDVKFVGPDATKITSAEEQKSLIADYKLLFGGEEFFGGEK